MAKIKLGINGFGRIGRIFYRAALKSPDFMNRFDVVAVNDITDSKTLAHLLRYDSVHRTLNGEIEVTKDGIAVNGNELKVLVEKDPANLPWRSLGVEYVLESTGLFTKEADASKHIKAGAMKVMISAPAEKTTPTFVLGVNEEKYDPQRHSIVSMASCTTNSLAPMAKVLSDNFGVVRGFMTTIHAYTNDQRILDLPHKDLRRARAAALSIIPTSTGAAKAIGLAIPELEGKMDGIAMRVPVPDGSVTDLVTEVNRPVTKEQVNEAFKKAAASSKMKGILEYTEEPIVSSDVIGNPASAIVDGLSTNVMKDTLVKTLSWYDNEWGYSCRLVDMFVYMAKRS
jgi:glyceraldehyde 3-phosphate dehydrogenase